MNHGTEGEATAREVEEYTLARNSLGEVIDGERERSPPLRIGLSGYLINRSLRVSLLGPTPVSAGPGEDKLAAGKFSVELGANGSIARTDEEEVAGEESADVRQSCTGDMRRTNLLAIII